eukprot:3582779-Prymnesium_polylepis.1
MAPMTAGVAEGVRLTTAEVRSLWLAKFPPTALRGTTCRRSVEASRFSSTSREQTRLLEIADIDLLEPSRGDRIDTCPGESRYTTHPRPLNPP